MKQIRKLIVMIVGSTLLLLGIAMLFLPGPGTVILAVGVALLASEFWWARWLIKRGREQSERVVHSLSGDPRVEPSTSAGNENDRSSAGGERSKNR